MDQVYFIGSGGTAIKIGYTSKDPNGRLSHLQVGNPHILTLLAAVPGTPKLERALHKRFDAEHLHGEWFRATDELRELVQHARAAGTLDGFESSAEIVESARKALGRKSPEVGKSWMANLWEDLWRAWRCADIGASERITHTISETLIGYGLFWWENHVGGREDGLGLKDTAYSIIAAGSEEIRAAIWMQAALRHRRSRDGYMDAYRAIPWAREISMALDWRIGGGGPDWHHGVNATLPIGIEWEGKALSAERFAREVQLLRSAICGAWTIQAFWPEGAEEQWSPPPPPQKKPSKRERDLVKRLKEQSKQKAA